MFTGERRLAGFKAALVTIVAVGLLVVAPGAERARAGQSGAYNPQVVQPNNQGNGAVLELPANPAAQGQALTLPQARPPAPQGGTLNLPQTKAPARQAGTELTLPEPSIAHQEGYEQVTVTVTDQSGNYVTGLQKGDFRVLLDGQERPVTFLRQDTDTPVSVGIVVDTSGSMEPKIAQARAAIAQFLGELNPRDDIFLFAFSNRPFLLQPFTTNHSLVMARLALLHAWGQTALYDTVLDGLLMVKHGRWDKKALLVVTDGMDNTSVSSLQEVIGQARRMHVLIYSIGIGNPNSSSMPAIALGPFLLGGDIDRVDTQTLQTLSNETGARTFIVREVGDGALLRQDCAAISRELRQQYTVGFVAPDPGRAGYRSLRVDVPTHPGADVRVRKGIEVGPAAYAGGATTPPPP